MFSESCLYKSKLGCKYTFPINLALIGNSIIVKSKGKWWIQTYSSYLDCNKEIQKIFLCVHMLNKQKRVFFTYKKTQSAVTI